ncbi:MAG: helix-turn-helix transcriptional regulator [Dehalococcoidia bacterium]
MSISSTQREQLVESLRDKEYRDLSVAEHISTGLAFQIRAMREARGWTQEDLARRAGMQQERISILENPDAARPTLATLKRIASAFDVALEVRLVSFSDLVDWTANLSGADLVAPSFDDDTRLDRTPAGSALGG